MTTQKLYLEVMKKAVNNYLYLGGTETFDSYRTLAPQRYKRFKWAVPEVSRPHTLLSKGQLDRLEKIMLACIESRVLGDFIEAGVFRGGAAIFMSAVLKAYNVKDRKVWVADSFQGIPFSKKVLGDPVDKWKDRWAAQFEQVEANFKRYGLLNNNVRFIKGYFSTTLSRAPLGKLAVVRLDADSYESTMDALEVLYPKIPVGGYVYIDDWHLPGCRAAVMDYRKSKGITERIDQTLDAMWKVRRVVE
jgi:O-methyltransferase